MNKYITKAAQIGIMTSLLASRAFAQVPDAIDQGTNSARPTGASDNLFGAGSIFQRIADTLIFIVGAVAVIMLIIGGLRYVLSSGDSSAVQGAKNTILYAIIGIIVAILAFAAVRFVIGQFNT
jgi:hypothetical protein